MNWCCELHNEVNVILEKPLFPCNEKSLDDRWANGCVDDEINE